MAGNLRALTSDRANRYERPLVLGRSAALRGRLCAVSIAVGIGLVARTGAAAEPGTSTAVNDRVTYDFAIDLPIALAAGSIWLGSQLMQPILAAKDCRWCDRADDGSDTLNGVDKAMRGLRWSSTRTANDVSNAIGYVVSPLSALGLNALAAELDGRINEAPANTLLILEATFVASTITQLVKFTVGRERPFVHYLPDDEKTKTSKPSDNNVSFFSAHTNFSFAIAVSSGTIASLRGYRHAPWVWAGGLTVAASVGYLRIAADRHYFTDVLTGALVGSIAGFTIPFLFHRKVGASESTGLAPSSLSADGTTLSASWTW